MDFNPEGDPKEERYKWMQEYLRLQSESWNEAEIVKAREHLRYFIKKLEDRPKKDLGPAQPPPSTKDVGSPPQKGEPEKTESYKRKTKPWPGWNKIISKL